MDEYWNDLGDTVASGQTSEAHARAKVAAMAWEDYVTGSATPGEREHRTEVAMERLSRVVPEADLPAARQYLASLRLSAATPQGYESQPKTVIDGEGEEWTRVSEESEHVTVHSYVPTSEIGRSPQMQTLEQIQKEYGLASRTSAKTATRYCTTHDVYVGEGNADTHAGEDCNIETRKKAEGVTVGPGAIHSGYSDIESAIRAAQDNAPISRQVRTPEAWHDIVIFEMTNPDGSKKYKAVDDPDHHDSGGMMGGTWQDPREYAKEVARVKVSDGSVTRTASSRHEAKDGGGFTKEKNDEGKWVVTDTNGNVKSTHDSESAAQDKVDSLYDAWRSRGNSKESVNTDAEGTERYQAQPSLPDASWVTPWGSGVADTSGGALPDGPAFHQEPVSDPTDINDTQRVTSSRLAQTPFRITLGSLRTKAGDPGDHTLRWYENRADPDVKPSSADADPDDSWGSQTKSRPSTAEDEKKIEKGEWISEDADGKSGDDKQKGSDIRPQLKNSALDRLLAMDEDEFASELEGEQVVQASGYDQIFAQGSQVASPVSATEITENTITSGKIWEGSINSSVQVSKEGNLYSWRATVPQGVGHLTGHGVATTREGALQEGRSFTERMAITFSPNGGNVQMPEVEGPDSQRARSTRPQVRTNQKPRQRVDPTMDDPMSGQSDPPVEPTPPPPSNTTSTAAASRMRAIASRAMQDNPDMSQREAMDLAREVLRAYES